MNQKFRNRLFIWILVMLAIPMLLCCNMGKGTQPLSLEKLSNTSERILTEAYRKYLQSFDLPISVSKEIKSGLMPYIGSGFNQGLIQKPDFLYYPSTLWQIFSINGDKKWARDAKKISDRIIVSGFYSEFNSYAMILHNYYLQTRDREYLNLLIKTLSERISEKENDAISKSFEQVVIEKLLENEVLFFASKETGDPVFRNFALQNSELIYNNFPLIDSFVSSENPKLQLLKNRRLAIGLYGFSYLFKETGMEKYKRLSNLLADNFARIYNQAESEKTIESAQCINHEMDLVAQVMVAIALFDLGDHQENNFRETSSQLFQHILLTLNKYENDPEATPSFKLFYYLFEYEKRLHALGKRGILVTNTSHTI